MKKNDLLVLILIFIIIFSIIIIKPINNLDEIWNYNTARVISEGLTPYKDVSMITTPLLPMVTVIFLKIFANEVIISRILAAILWTGILFMIYKIFEKLLKEKNISLIFTALIGILCRDIYCIDYNVAVLFLALIILNQELKNITQYNKKQDFIIGLLAGLAICTKQSIGATLAIIVVGYKILFIENKEQFRQYLKIAVTRILGIILPVGIFFVYLILNNALNDFINYAVLGISTFSNKIKYITLLSNQKIEIRILSTLMPLSIIIMALTLITSKIKNKENENILNILTVLVYSLSIIIVMYPISDEIHFLIGGLISIIGLLYIIFLLGKFIYDKLKNNKKIKFYKILTSIICVILFAVILKAGVTNIYNYVKVEKNKNIKHYYNIEISNGLSEKISNIDNYILQKEEEGKKVYILDAEAAVYMIPINKYNKDYDMFLKGNIGKDGEQGQIEKIKQKNENELFLIRKPEIASNWQTPLNVVNYVRENLEKVDSISIYDVYK